MSMSRSEQFYFDHAYMLSSLQLGVFMHVIQSTGPPVVVPIAYVRTPHWKRQVERAMREPYSGSLVTAVHAAEEALFLRWQALGDSAWGGEERIAMAAGADELLSIKVHRLNWPDVRLNS
jgi:hypothetical protein